MLALRVVVILISVVLTAAGCGGGEVACRRLGCDPWAAPEHRGLRAGSSLGELQGGWSGVRPHLARRDLQPTWTVVCRAELRRVDEL